MPMPPNAPPPPPAGRPKLSLADIKRRLISEAEDVDSILAEADAESPPADMPPEEAPVEDAPMDEEPPTEEPAADEGVSPEERAKLVEYGPPDRWTPDTMRRAKQADLDMCRDAWGKLPPEEQAAVRREHQRASQGMKPPKSGLAINLGG